MQKRAQAHLRMLFIKCLYKSYIYLIYIVNEVYLIYLANEVIVLPLAFIASLFLYELRSR